MRQISIFGVPITPITVPELHQYIYDKIQAGEKTLIPYINVYGLNLAFEYTWLQDFFNRANLVFCDGAGVVLAAKLLGTTIPGRITYADWTWQLAEFAEANHFTFYFLGASPGVAEQAAQKLRGRYPNLRIVGTHHGFFDKNQTSAENLSVLQEINAAQPDILLVAFGMPLQERWLMENWNQLNVSVGLTGGAVFDYISGNLRRGPRWLTDYGMEWIARLLIEPRRLWKRYVIGNPLFLWRVFRQRISAQRGTSTEEISRGRYPD